MVKHSARGVYEATFEGVPTSLRKALELARRNGASITVAGSNHLIVRIAGQRITVALTPGSPDIEAKRLRSKLRRAGVVIR